MDPSEKAAHFSILIPEIIIFKNNILKCELNVMFSYTLITIK